MTNRDSTNRTTTTDGAVRYGKRRHGLGWVPWAALLGLLLVAALVYLVLQNVNDNNDKSGIDVTDDEVGLSAPATSSANADSDDSYTAPASSVPVAASPATASTGSGTVSTANGTDLLTLSESKSLATLVGQTVTANDVVVRSVVADEGFWVGNSADQLFVHLSTAARGTGESAVQVLAGQHVRASGTLTKAPASAASLGVSSDEGAQQLANEGAYLEATSFHIN